ncbi:hypothetical protein RR48_00228 [Papilio machaon]|uniref:Uncharacterized protein n=1 Tax=Papilio machaon TaxID=76193 RepID=A0A0N1PJZ8_PAPMA|nr:hypothetical protein RR48_00228 [Papilio machaon]
MAEVEIQNSQREYHVRKAAPNRVAVHALVLRKVALALKVNHAQRADLGLRAALALRVDLDQKADLRAVPAPRVTPVRRVDRAPDQRADQGPKAVQDPDHDQSQGLVRGPRAVPEVGPVPGLVPARGLGLGLGTPDQRRPCLGNLFLQVKTRHKLTTLHIYTNLIYRCGINAHGYVFSVL